MGQTVYVLMQLEGGKEKEWRPAAVVTNPDVAAEWQARGKDVDWVPLELDDIKYLQPGEVRGMPTPTFQPRKVTPNEQAAEEINAQLQAQNQRLQEIVKKLQKRLGIKEEKPKQPVASLLKKKE